MSTSWAGGAEIAGKRQLVIDWYGTRCWLCGGQTLPTAQRDHPLKLTIDHVIPRKHGGTHEIENLRPAHKICNERRGARLVTNDGTPTLDQPRPPRAAESGAAFFRGVVNDPAPPSGSPPARAQQIGSRRAR